MATTVQSHQVTPGVKKLVDRVAAGERILIMQDGKTVAMLVRADDEGPIVRTGGQWRGKGWVADDFDNPVPPEMLDGYGIIGLIGRPIDKADAGEGEA